MADVACSNKYIPDSGNKIFAGQRDGQGDPKLSQFFTNQIADLGKSPVGNAVVDSDTTQYPKIGYQNAPKFCENMDKSLATNAFIIPDLQPGKGNFVFLF